MLMRSSSTPVLDSFFGGQAELELCSPIRRSSSISVQASPGRHQLHGTDDGGNSISVSNMGSKFKRVQSETDLSNPKLMSTTPGRAWSRRMKSRSFGSFGFDGELGLEDVLWNGRLDEATEEEEFEDSETQSHTESQSFDHPYGEISAKSHLVYEANGASRKNDIFMGFDAVESKTSRAASLICNRPEQKYAESVTGSVYTDEGLGSGNGGGLSGGGGYGGRGGGSGSDSNSTDDYYQKMLQANPGNALLLRNYAKFLHEVQGDVEKAEEYYGRAILASPGDGDALSLYAKLIWDAHKDVPRAESYFGRAVQAAPDDCYVRGAYAHFLWNAEDEDEDEQEEDENATLQPNRVPAKVYGTAAAAF